MPRPLMLFVAAGLLAFTPSSAGAGTLVSATLVGPFTVTTGTGALAASGSASHSSSAWIQLSMARQAGTRTVVGTPYYALSTTLGGIQTLRFTGGRAAVDRGLSGRVHIDFVALPESLAHILTLPLSIGASTVLRAQGTNLLLETLTITQSFFGWQTGPFTYRTTVPAGGLHEATVGTFRATGHNGLDASGNGTLTLIAPSVITTTMTLGGAPFRTARASATVLTLTFVPEPGPVLLLGAGMGGLALWGRRSGAEGA